MQTDYSLHNVRDSAVYSFDRETSSLRLSPPGRFMRFASQFARAFSAGFAMVSIVGLFGCGSSSNASTLTTPTVAARLATDTFTGSIDQNGTAVFPFTVTTSGYGLLAGYTSISPASIAALGLGVGAWDASSSTCSLNVSQNDTGRSGSTALSGTPNSGSYCLRVYDAGNIPAGMSASYTVQVQHY